QPVLAAIILVIAVLMTPILFLLQQVILFIFSALNLDAGAFGNMLQVPEGVGPVEQQGRELPPNPLETLLYQIEQLLNQLGGVQMCITVFAILAVVTVILLTMRRRHQSSVLEGEEREDLDGDALGGLRNLLRRGLDALNHALNTVGQFGLGRNLFAALTVRRIYAQMAALAAQRGFPRAPSETPYEYRDALDEAYAGSHTEVALVTEAYVRVHYGEAPESQEALQQVIDAWQHLKRVPAAGEAPSR
ncbi:MAG: DUF4129 domain-containing protein, partial [Anaerolineae bacterium]|nr:DUF4129 domain-containing protein [Anaerolineae bacterium]